MNINPSKIKYRELRDALRRFGYEERITERQHIVFRHPNSRLPIYLPDMAPDDYVPPVEILSIRNVLENAGFWSSLMGQTGTDSPEEARHVLQTLSGIKPNGC